MPFFDGNPASFTKLAISSSARSQEMSSHASDRARRTRGEVKRPGLVVVAPSLAASLPPAPLPLSSSASSSVVPSGAFHEVGQRLSAQAEPLLQKTDRAVAARPPPARPPHRAPACRRPTLPRRRRPAPQGRRFFGRRLVGALWRPLRRPRLDSDPNPMPRFPPPRLRHQPESLSASISWTNVSLLHRLASPASLFGTLSLRAFIFTNKRPSCDAQNLERAPWRCPQIVHDYGAICPLMRFILSFPIGNIRPLT